MKLVKIFVASSNELENDRIYLGDCVRKINDLYEYKGIRIKLYKWEDFLPYYSGVRSQDEYNACLRRCNAVIGLFKTVLGEFTSEEINFGLEILGRDSVYCYTNVPVGSSIPEKILDFLTEIGTNVRTYSHESQLYDIVKSVVDDTLSRGVEDNYAHVQRTTYLYATIPDDNAEHIHKIGDAIRSLDDDREEFHKDRCKLLPLRVPDFISRSHLYMAFIKDQIAESDKSEIRTAGEQLRNSTLEEVAIYYDPGGGYKGSELWQEMSSAGYFMPEYKSVTDVVYNISRYLDRRRVTCTNDVEVERGYLTANGVHIGPLRDISAFAQDKEIIKHTVRQEEIEGNYSARIEELSDNTDFKADSELIDLSCELNERDQELQKRILLYFLHQQQSISVSKDTVSLKYDTIGKIKQIQDEIYNTVYNKRVSEQQLAKRIEVLEPLLLKALEQEWITDEKYFEIHSAFLMLFEKYFDVYPIHLYLSIIDFVDSHNIVNLRTEEIREKISAAYCQMGKFQESIMLHRKVLENYRTLDDGSLSYRRKLSQSYLEFCSLCLNYEIRPYLKDLLNIMEEWKTVADLWYSRSTEYLPEVGNYMAVLLRLQSMYGCVEDRIFNLHQIHNVYLGLLVGFTNLSVLAKVNAIYLGNILASFYIDHPGEYTDIADSFNKAKYYLESSLAKTRQLYKINPQRALEGFSLLYHNYAFMLVKQGELPDAKKYYESEIDIRRQFLRKKLLVHAKDDLGESLVNYGDLLRQIKDYPNAISSAQEAIKLYESSKSDADQKLDYHDMNIYKSKQLLGSIYYDMGGNVKRQGLDLLMESWNWARLHPDNTYMPSFIGTSGRILKNEGLI